MKINSMNPVTSAGPLSRLAFVLCACLTVAVNAEETEDPGKTTIVEDLAARTRPTLAVIRPSGRDGDEAGVGTGFVIASNGLIATCHHVVGEGRPVEVELADGRRFAVEEVRAWDRARDLAVIRIAVTNLPALELGDSAALRQGAFVVAMGNPMGLEHSVVQGVVSARREVDGMEMLQLAIPIEPGNSGGPVLDRDGRVQGIMNMKSAVTSNLGFAIPINDLKPLLEKPNPIPMHRWVNLGALNTNEWEAVFGARWRRQGGRILVDEPGDSFGGRALCLMHQPPPQRPYELTVTVRLEDESGAAGLVFGSDGRHRHYGFYPSAGNLRLTRFDGPDVYSWTILEQTQSDHYKPGEWNAIKVRWEPDRILCYVNGHLAIESMDQGLREGRVGLAKFRQTKAAFKHFEVGPAVRGPGTTADAELMASLAARVRDWDQGNETALLTALRDHPDAGRTVLRDQALALDNEADRLRRLSDRLHKESVRGELVAALEAPEEAINLLRAGLLLARLDQPDLDVAAYETEARSLAKALEGELPDGASERERVAALIRFLFQENGFHGSRQDYYHRANSYLNQVLDDREGLPITLSVILLEVGRLAGITNLHGVALPGRFLVMHVDPGSGREQLIDPFEGGELIDLEKARDLVWQTAGLELKSEHLEHAAKRDIVLRMLRNLLGTAERAEQFESALSYLDTIVALAPSSALERLQRAGLRLRTGDRAGARDDIRWVLDHPPPGLDADRVLEMYQWLFDEAR